MRTASSLAFIWTVTLLPVLTTGQNRPGGSDIAFKREAATLLLDVDQVAGALGWQAKTISQGKLLILCQLGDQNVCVPVQLEEVKSINYSGHLFVDATVLKLALGFTIDEKDGRVSVRTSKSQVGRDSDIPTYNAAWGEGRGFRVGQTVPDIPLYDMQGREVRFSSFLGKRYILYCWASW